jgi:hypothetical protein
LANAAILIFKVACLHHVIENLPHHTCAPLILLLSLNASIIGLAALLAEKYSAFYNSASHDKEFWGLQSYQAKIYIVISSEMRFWMQLQNVN